MKKFLSIQKIVDDPEWQSIRISMLGTWIRKRKENCQRLENYLEDFSDPLKVRRVHNYLTGSGFRSGKIRGKEIDNLILKIKSTNNE